MGFHAPQEAAKVLGEAIDYARQGELAASRVVTLPTKMAAANGTAAAAGPTVAAATKLP